MKTLELSKIMKKLILPNKFVKKGRLAYYTLTHSTGAIVLIGIYLDNSIDPNKFFVCYFAQCLYEPFCTYNFSLGDRIGSHWDINSVSQLQERMSEFDVFNGLDSFDDFVLLLEKHPYYGNKIGRDNYFALTYFILKEYDKSLHYLDKIISLKNEKNCIFFSQEIENALIMKNYIIVNDYDKGIAQMLQWQEQTMKGLRLKL